MRYREWSFHVRMAALEVDCETCGSAAGVGCRTRRGASTLPHARRWAHGVDVVRAREAVRGGR
jgi:hypothetical protein